MVVKHFTSRLHNFVTDGSFIYYDNLSKELKTTYIKYNVEFPETKYNPIIPFHLLRKYFETRNGINHFFDLRMGVYGKFNPKNSLITLFDTIIQDFHLNFGNPLVHEWYLNNFDKIITCSNSSKNMLSESFGINKDKIEVIYAGVNTYEFYPCDENMKQIYKDSFLIPEDSLVISSIGNMSPHKNFSFLIDVLKELNKSCDAYFIKGGYFDKRNSAAYYGELQMRAKIQGVSDKVRWVYNSSNINSIYHASDVYVSPSLIEGFNMPLIESMACGIPVAASNLSSHPEVVGDIGSLFDLNVNDCVESIMKCNDNKNVNKLIARAKQFSWIDSANKLDTLYAEMMEN